MLRLLLEKTNPAGGWRAGDRGFTLIELLVVMIVIGILTAIAIPMYTAQRERAQRAVVQSDLRNAAAAAMVCATDNGGAYGSCGIPELESNYGFNKTDGVDMPVDQTITGTRWAVDAHHSANPRGTAYYFDTEDGSQVRKGRHSP